jgi:hypothetical protein
VGVREGNSGRTTTKAAIDVTQPQGIPPEMTLDSYGNPRLASSRRWEIRRGPDVYVCELVVVDGYWAEARVSRMAN